MSKPKRKEKETMTTELALFGQKTDMIPAYAQEDGAMGNEGVTQADLAVPLLKILQPQSPELESVEGAREGWLYNSVTGELCQELYVANLYFKKDFAVFKQRDLGGGYEGSFLTNREAEDHRASLPGAGADYDVVETHKHACMIIDPSTGQAIQPILIMLDKTKIAFSKKWNAEIQLQGKNAPRFSMVWKIYPLKKSNKKGRWYVLDGEFVGWLPQATYEIAKETYESIKESL